MPPDTPVICAQCARIWVFKQGRTACPKCHFVKWYDVRVLIKEVVKEKRKRPPTPNTNTLLTLLWKASELVVEGDIAEDVG